MTATSRSTTGPPSPASSSMVNGVSSRQQNAPASTTRRGGGAPNDSRSVNAVSAASDKSTSRPTTSSATKSRAQAPSLSTSPSYSLPSTPSVHTRKMSDEYRTPPPPIRVPDGISPRSARSESDSTVRDTAYTPAQTRCRFETGMAFYRRRIPYSIGGDPLEPVPNVKAQLDKNAECKLTTEAQELYDQLLPSQDSEERRAQLVTKLERILREQWPDNDIKVHVFGSSGNLLCTDDSDGQLYCWGNVNMDVLIF